MTSLKIASTAAQAADHRKGEDILILDLREVSSIADFFVIATGTSEPHLKAIRNEIEERLKKEGVKVRGVDGFPMSHWVVIDCFDVLIHVFSKERREFYALERLWGDAPRVEFTA